MTGRSPGSIYSLWYAIRDAMSQAQLSGILGDAAHFAHGGYHVPRAYCSADDYSVELAQDKLGKSDCASALDVSLPPDLMIAVTRRLMAAAKANDPQLAAMREFFGTVDGVRVIGWDRHNPDNAHDDTYTTSDDSHLWHVHLSFYREFADDFDALAPIASVFTGKDDDMPTAEEIAKAVWNENLSDGHREQRAAEWLKQSRNLSDPRRVLAHIDDELAKLNLDPPALASVKLAAQQGVEAAFRKAGA